MSTADHRAACALLAEVAQDARDALPWERKTITGTRPVRPWPIR